MECHGQLDVGRALINHAAIGGIRASIVRYTSLVDGIADRRSKLIGSRALSRSYRNSKRDEPPDGQWTVNASPTSIEVVVIGGGQSNR